MFVWAYVTIVGLTWILVAMNVRWVLRQYARDHVRSRLINHLITLLILGSVIIVITHMVIDKVIESEEQLRDYNAERLEVRKALARYEL